MTKNYYTKKYFQDRAEGQKCMAFIIAQFLKKQCVKTVLDVGCGSGWLMRYLKKRGFDVKGCDIADEAIKLSGAVKASAVKLPFKNNHFEAVLGISIIEHLKPKEAIKFLREAKRVLKPKSWLFLVTPNLATPLRFLMGQKWGGYGDPTHINLYSPKRLKKDLSKEGFSNLKLTYDFSADIPFDWGFPKIFFKLPKAVQNFLNWLVIATPFHIMRHSFFLAAQKKD